MRIDTDEPSIGTYDIRTSPTWGDQFSEGDKYESLVVEETHAFIHKYAFGVDGDGGEKVTMKDTRFEIPADLIVLGTPYETERSECSEVVEVSQSDCVISETDCPGVSFDPEVKEAGGASGARAYRSLLKSQFTIVLIPFLFGW